MERDRVQEVLRRWARMIAEDEAGGADAAARVSRLDFLHALIEGKDAAGEVLEKAAALAPPETRDEILGLAAIDFRHASELRKLLLKEYPEPPPGMETR